MQLISTRNDESFLSKSLLAAARATVLATACLPALGAMDVKAVEPAPAPVPAASEVVNLKDFSLPALPAATNVIVVPFNFKAPDIDLNKVDHEKAVEKASSNIIPAGLIAAIGVATSWLMWDESKLLGIGAVACAGVAALGAVSMMAFGYSDLALLAQFGGLYCGSILAVGQIGMMLLPFL